MMFAGKEAASFEIEVLAKFGFQLHRNQHVDEGSLGLNVICHRIEPHKCQLTAGKSAEMAK
ncbi:MAG: hypothetical protein ING71_08515 [Rhodocyclaceae bacterium]|nr:hypothetical protein [Rhodocyclaceae bacterium]MCA3078814.1 hypothetical protein [Rhodocyclaceae bacterium]MCA3086728.1 hypothetical protein [Rhodocyclaceae bacterium]